MGEIDAVIIAGGGGTKMRPFTRIAPKALLPLGKKPLLCYHLEKLQIKGVREIVVVSNNYEDVFKRLRGHYSFRFVRDGGRGAVAALYTAVKELRESDGWLVIQGNVFTTLSYDKFIKAWDGKSVLVSLAKIEAKDAARFGTARIENGRIAEIHEKKNSSFNLALAGIYIFPKSILPSLVIWTNTIIRFHRFGDFLQFLLQSHEMKPFVIKEFWEYADDERGYAKLWRWWLNEGCLLQDQLLAKLAENT